MKNNVVGWFELPVENMDRAVQFYQTVFEFKMTPFPNPGLEMTLFPMIPEGLGAGGALVKHPEFYFPSKQGPLIYFTAHSGDLATELARVEAAGGKVLIEKRLISEDTGYMGVFIDTEGNRVAIHSRK